MSGTVRGAGAAPRRPVVAIDGPAASGKGTLARRLAAALGLPYLDSGLLYRAVARRCLDAGARDEAEAADLARAIGADDLARTDLRTPEVDRMASRVAAWPAVRAALLTAQRDVAAARGAVVDGRDIGTVVFPGADAKLFLVASPDARAARRLRQRGEETGSDAVARERAAIEARDEADRTRDAAPLLAAADAMRLDTTDLDADATFAAAMALVGARLGEAGARGEPDARDA